MNSDLEYIDLFNKFLKGDLAGSELEAFQKKLDSDNAFKQAFEEHQAILDVIHQERLICIKTKLNKIQAAPPKYGSKRKYLAAAVLLSFTTGAGLWYAVSNNDVESIENTTMHSTTQQVTTNQKAIFSDREDSIMITEVKLTNDVVKPNVVEKRTPVDVVESGKAKIEEQNDSIQDDATPMVLENEVEERIVENKDAVNHVPDVKEESMPAIAVQSPCVFNLNKGIKNSCELGKGIILENLDQKNTVTFTYDHITYQDYIELDGLTNGRYSINASMSASCDTTLAFVLRDKFCAPKPYLMSLRNPSTIELPTYQFDYTVSLIDQTGKLVVQYDSEEGLMWDVVQDINQKPGVYILLFEVPQTGETSKSSITVTH